MEKWSLKALRVNAGYTQKTACKKIGVTQKTLSSWENGLTYPNQKQIEQICSVYNVAYDRINFVG